MTGSQIIIETLIEQGATGVTLPITKHNYFVSDVNELNRKIRHTGTAMTVSVIIVEQGGNVTAVHHEHSNEGSDVNGCYLRLTLETRNFEHIAQIKKTLTDQEFKII